MTWSPGERPWVTSHLSPIVRSAVTTRSCARLWASITQTVASPRGLRETAACETRMAPLATACAGLARTNMPSSSRPCGFGNRARASTALSCRVGLTALGELDAACVRIGAAVLQGKPDVGRRSGDAAGR